MSFKRKSLDEHVEEFVLPFGKWKDMYLKEVPIEYLDWVLREYQYLSDWHRKLIDHYIVSRAIEINEKIAEEAQQKAERDAEIERDMLETSAWVDENF
jgi:uncharacterized protein (DUF3820 family)